MVQPAYTNGHGEVDIAPRPEAKEQLAGPVPNRKGQQAALVNGNGVGNRVQELLTAQQPKGTTKPEPTTIYTAREIMAMDLPEPSYVINGLITEGLNILVSRPKLGKSWFSLQAGIAVASDQFAFGSLSVWQGDVLYLALEDNHRRLKSRLTKVLAGNEVPERLELITSVPRIDKGGLERLYEWVQSVSDPRLIMIDTLAKIRALKSGQCDHYADDYYAMGQLKEFADAHYLTVMVNHHDRKAQAEDALDDVSGTIGITGAADTILLMRRERGELDASLYITGRDIDEKEVALDWDQAACRWTKSDGEARELRMSQARLAVLECVRQHGPITPVQIAGQLGKKREAIRRLVAKLAGDNEIRANGSNQYVAVTAVTG